MVLASQSPATVVILMGMNKLSEIVLIYQSNRTDELPVAIISEVVKHTLNFTQYFEDFFWKRKNSFFKIWILWGVYIKKTVCASIYSIKKNQPI